MLWLTTQLYCWCFYVLCASYDLSSYGGGTLLIWDLSVAWTSGVGLQKKQQYRLYTIRTT